MNAYTEVSIAPAMGDLFTVKEVLQEINKPSILLVEDDSIIGHLLVHMLSQRGFRVHLAVDGLQAVKLLKAINTPDLILLDLVLPIMDGFRVLHHIRATEGWQKVPVILLTSKKQESNIVRAFSEGANDYVTKPFQMEELIARIKRLLPK
jgi:two-component system, OmpR family, alkaline phosphatase synthesis response regulator PhoP